MPSIIWRILLGISFKEQRPLTFPDVVLGSDPDARDFQLDSKHNERCDKPNTSENLGESVCTGLITYLLHSGEGGLLSHGRANRT